MATATAVLGDVTVTAAFPTAGIGAVPPRPPSEQHLNPPPETLNLNIKFPDPNFLCIVLPHRGSHVSIDPEIFLFIYPIYFPIFLPSQTKTLFRRHHETKPFL